MELMQTDKFFDEVMIVTVIYRRRLKETAVYKTLLHDKPHVTIIDNTPDAEDPGDLPSGWIFRKAPDNPGLSSAYNRASRFAGESGCKWLLIADQDTVFPDETVNAYTEAVAAEADRGISVFFPEVKIGDGSYISPVPMEHYRTFPANGPLDGVVDLDNTAVINSGLMVSVEAFEKAGGYKEDVFLDFSDFQFIERLCHAGYRHGFVVPIVLRQDFSNLTDSSSQKQHRYDMFCRSLSAYEPYAPNKHSHIRDIAFRRAVSLCVATKSMQPLRTFAKYFRKSNKR